MSVIVVVEGNTDVPVASRLACDAKLNVASIYPMRGKDELDKKLKGFNEAAKGSPWFVLRDLDEDHICAPGYIRQLRFVPSRWMVFRLAMRSMESWLMADKPGLAEFLEVSTTLIADEPDRLRNPKRCLVDLARKSKSRSIRRALVPRDGDSVQVGPEYEANIVEFVSRYWNLDRASAHSPSLRRARMALRTLAEEWKQLAAGQAAE